MTRLKPSIIVNDALASEIINLYKSLKRFISWVFLIAFISSIFLWAKDTIFYGMPLIGLGLFFEWIRLFSKKNAFLTAIACYLPFVAYTFGFIGIEQGVLISLAVNVVIVLTRRRFSSWQRMVLLFVGQIYIGFGVLSAQNYHHVLIWLILIVLFTDTGAYVFGKWIGGPKLASLISPNKTWAGAVGGMITCLLCFQGITLFGKWVIPAPFDNLVYIALLSTVGQIGDLIESACKRFFQVKDTGSIIPGHGGLLDRTDSFIAVAIVLSVIQFIFK